MDENDETLDLVDVNDVVVGTVRRGDMVKVGYKSPKGYVRFAVAFILNKEEVWVPIRGIHKSIAPGGCDFGAAEHVLLRESYEQAIERAFLEEAGMKIDAAVLTPLGKLLPTDDKPSYESVYMYRLQGSENPKYSREEFSSASWVPMRAFEEMLIPGLPTKTALLPAFRLPQTRLTCNN